MHPDDPVSTPPIGDYIGCNGSTWTDLQSTRCFQDGEMYWGPLSRAFLAINPSEDLINGIGWQDQEDNQIKATEKAMQIMTTSTLLSARNRRRCRFCLEPAGPLTGCCGCVSDSCMRVNMQGLNPCTLSFVAGHWIVRCVEEG